MLPIFNISLIGHIDAHRRARSERDLDLRSLLVDQIKRFRQIRQSIYHTRLLIAFIANAIWFCLVRKDGIVLVHASSFL